LGLRGLQPVREKMRLEMVIVIEIKIVDGRSPGFFSNEPFKKRPVMTIQDSDFYADNHFESHLFRKGLYQYVVIGVVWSKRLWVLSYLV